MEVTFRDMLYLPTKFGFATSWNGRDIEPPIIGTQYFTRLCMLRISTSDLTFHLDCKTAVSLTLGMRLMDR